MNYDMIKSVPRPTVAEFIADKFAESEQIQREVAEQCGFENPNVITMFKTGAAKLPLSRVGPLAKALKVDPAHLLRLVKGYDAREFIGACQGMGVIPHVAQNTSGRRSAAPDVIAASAGYALSQRKRKLIEQGFGWAKTVGRIRQVMVRGLKRVDHLFVLTMTAYKLTRMRSGANPSAGALRHTKARKTPANQRKRLQEIAARRAM